MIDDEDKGQRMKVTGISRIICDDCIFGLPHFYFLIRLVFLDGEFWDGNSFYWIDFDKFPLKPKFLKLLQSMF